MMKLILVDDNDKGNELFSIQISYMNNEYVWISGKGIYNRNMQKVDEYIVNEIKKFIQSQGLNVEEGMWY